VESEEGNIPAVDYMSMFVEICSKDLQIHCSKWYQLFAGFVDKDEAVA